MGEENKINVPILSAKCHPFVSKYIPFDSFIHFIFINLYTNILCSMAIAFLSYPFRFYFPFFSLSSFAHLTSIHSAPFSFLCAYGCCLFFSFWHPFSAFTNAYSSTHNSIYINIIMCLSAGAICTYSRIIRIP